MARYPKPAEGSWTQHYPHLGTETVSYEDSISPEWYELEREAVFKRSWLHVGRLEEIPRKGSHVTREIAVADCSLIVVRGQGDEVRAFRNGLDGARTFVQRDGEVFDLDKSDHGLAEVHCDVFAGFIFVNLAAEPSQSLREYLGPMLLGIEDYPFHEMTDRYAFRTEVKSNWKVFSDAFMEFYHAPIVHGGQHLPPVRAQVRQMGYEAPHYQLDGPHGLVTTAGSLHRVWDMPPELVKASDRVTRSGLFGPWDHPDLGKLPAGINPGGVSPWGLSSFQFFPNFAILIWEAGWYNTHQYWPTSYNSLIFEGAVYSPPAKSAAERVGRETAAVSFKEYSLQDANTLEATQMGLETRIIDRWPLNDQEVLVRHFHRVVGHRVEQYQCEHAKG